MQYRDPKTDDVYMIWDRWVKSYVGQVSRHCPIATRREWKEEENGD